MRHCEQLLSRIENRNRLTIYGPSSVIGSVASQAGIGAGGGAMGATVGLLSNPVTAIIGAGLGVVQLIFGIKAHHKQAVKTEAAALSDLTVITSDAAAVGGQGYITLERFFIIWEQSGGSQQRRG